MEIKIVLETFYTERKGKKRNEKTDADILLV